jgi:hypothetical protein
MLALWKDLTMADENEVVIAIAASLYASQATEDAIRAEPDLEALAHEAWAIYYKLQRAVLNTKGEASRRANPDGPRVG